MHVSDGRLCNDPQLGAFSSRGSCDLHHGASDVHTSSMSVEDALSILGPLIATLESIKYALIMGSL